MEERYQIVICICIVILGAIISGCNSEMGSSSFQTQVALGLQQTEIAEEILLLSQTISADDRENDSIPAITILPSPDIENTSTATQEVILLTSESTNTPHPTRTPEIISPMLFADKTYFCRQAPNQNTEAHWMFSEGLNAAIIGKSTNDWWLISVSDPSTRTECCWIGGGVPSGDIGLVPIITDEIDRLSCP